MSLFQPSNQIKLTNVSIVRLKKGGQRFELACYPNKVLEWRNRITKDLNEVLQSRQPFLNVSKGQVAKSTDLKEAFGTDEVDKIVLEILIKGEIQVSAKERGSQMESLTREIATIVSQKCVDPRTKLPISISLIEQAMTERLHFNPNLTRSAKQQALEVIKALTTGNSGSGLSIARALMRLTVNVPPPEELQSKVKAACLPHFKQIEQEEVDEHGDVHWTVLVEPGSFKQVNEEVAKISRGRGTVHTLSLKVLNDI